MAGQQRRSPIEPQALYVAITQTCANPSPHCTTGSLLVTAGGTDVCVWHMLHSGQLVHRITAHQKTATSVLVSALAGAQPHITSAGLDGHVKVSGLGGLGVGTHVAVGVGGLAGWEVQ